LQLDDVDWQHDRLRIQRSKSRRVEIVPLEPSVGNAIAGYVRHGRPPSQRRTLFLTLRAPYRALSDGALRRLVRRYLAIVGLPAKGCGPHGLRHACARHLLEAGYSFKEVGDHLGHQSPDSTGIYIKVHLTALRLVAFDTLGGLA
jgi:integrase